MRRDAASRSGVGHGPRQRVCAAALQARSNGKPFDFVFCAQSRYFPVVERHQRSQHRPAQRQSAGFVERDRVDAASHLKRTRVLYQDATRRRHARTGHNRHGRRQAERTRAGDYQHRDRMDQCNLDTVAMKQPARQCRERDEQYHRHEDGGGAIDQSLDRRLGRLRVFDQPDDPGQHAFSADRPHFDHQSTVAVDRAPRQQIIGPLGDRQRLACEHRLVDLRLAFEHACVGRNALTGTYHQAIALHDLPERHVALGALPVAHAGLPE